jgi:carbohydrate ABC transporter substrate-binding protein, CUT1 family (TC 3.A.1.1.-)
MMTDEDLPESLSSTGFSRRDMMRASVGAGGMMLLAGCTGGGGGGDGGDAQTLQFLTMGVGNNIQAFFEENNAAFEEETGYSLDFTSITWDNAQSTLVTRVRGNEAPDVSRMPSRWLPQFKNLEAIDPLDDFMQGEFLDKFYPRVAETTIVDGSYYGIPWAYSNKALYYNKDLFEEAGLDPKTPGSTRGMTCSQRPNRSPRTPTRPRTGSRRRIGSRPSRSICRTTGATGRTSSMTPVRPW